MASAVSAISPLDISQSAPENPKSFSCCGCGAVRRCFSYISELYNRLVDPVNAATDMTQIVTNLTNARVFNVFLSLFQNATNATEERWIHYDSVMKVVRTAKILAIVTVPFALYSIFREAWSVCVGNSRLEASLRLAEGLSWLCQSLATALNGVQMMEIAVLQAVEWVFSLSVAAVFFSAATIILSCMQLAEGKEFLRKLNNTATSENERVKDLQEDSYAKQYDVQKYLEKHKNHIGKSIKIWTKITKVLSGGDIDFKGVINSLEERVKAKNFAHKLAIVSSVVSFIGMALLFSPILMPFGYGLLALASGVAVFQFVWDRRAQRRLENELEVLVPSEQ